MTFDVRSMMSLKDGLTSISLLDDGHVIVRCEDWDKMEIDK